jgi:phage shock protein C
MSSEAKRLYRSRTNRMLGGLCGGLGEFLGTDPTLIRLVTVLLTVFYPPTPLIYLVVMLIVPEEPLGQPAPLAKAPDAETDKSTPAE